MKGWLLFWLLTFTVTTHGQKNAVISKDALPDYDSISHRAATKLFREELGKISPVDIGKLKYYLDRGADIHARTVSNWSLLHEAAFQGDTDLILRCLQNGLDVNLVTTTAYSRHSVLYYATKNNHVDAALLLYRYNAAYCIPDGYNIIQYDSMRYQGNMLKEDRSGQGTAWFANGNIYEGNWLYNGRNGYGTFYWIDGSKYEGYWLAGSKNGKGTERWADGSWYSGDFKDDQLTGVGTYHWKNGDQYTGEWRNGQRQGYGVYTCGPRRKLEGNRHYRQYRGRWAGDRASGWGAYYTADTVLIADGWFLNGQLYRKHFIRLDSSASGHPISYVFVEPVSLVEGSLRLGTEHNIYKDWSVLFTGGAYLYSAKGWIVKGEVKKYFWNERPGFRSYMSFEYYYSQYAYDQKDSIAMPPYEKVPYTITKYITGLRVKVGSVQLFTHGLSVEWYAGAGIRYRNALSTLTPSQYAHINYGEDDYGVNAYTSAVSRSIRPDIALGLRFGIRY